MVYCKKIGIVDYLNCLPYEWALSEMLKLDKEIVVVRKNPAQLAYEFEVQDCGLYLLPIAAIQNETAPLQCFPYGIGCEGAVKSVLVFAHEPIEMLKTIYLDHASRTSNALLYILIHHFLQLKVRCSYPHQAPYNLKPLEGMIVIGDNALKENSYPYVYDLGELWYQHTGLPFFFAHWVVKGAFLTKIVELFNENMRTVLSDLAKRVNEEKEMTEQKKTYIMSNIKYEIGKREMESIRLFHRLREKIGAG